MEDRTKYKAGRIRSINGGTPHQLPPPTDPDGWTVQEWGEAISATANAGNAPFGFYVLALYQDPNPADDAEPDSVGLLVVAPEEIRRLMQSEQPTYRTGNAPAEQRPRRVGFDLSPFNRNSKPN